MAEQDFEYKGFKFEKTKTGWKVTLPSGMSKKIPDKPVEELKAGIDALTQQSEG